jgi:threonine dehydrogenase-like Zn-dependent dehydrogenase
MTAILSAPVSSRTATMRAAVVASPGNVKVRTVSIPEPRAGQMRIGLEGCGVCSSNLPTWEGRPWFNYPLAPGELGHEGWGIVDAIGGGVDEFQIGDRVGFLSNRSYAEFDLSTPQSTVKIPAELADLPFPAEPLGCAMNIFRRCEIRAGQTVAIIGIGFLGALLTQLAKSAGARVIAISRRPDSVELASRMEADHAIRLDENWNVIRQVAELTGGSGGYDVRGFCDCVIECTGKQSPLELAGELCGVRAKLIIAGYHQDGLRQINVQSWNWRGLDVINAHERDPAIYLRGMQDAVEAARAGTLDPLPLYTHRFPLERLAEALNATEHRPTGFVKALITF